VSHVSVTLHSTKTASNPYRYRDVDEIIDDGLDADFDARIATAIMQTGMKLGGEFHVIVDGMESKTSCAYCLEPLDLRLARAFIELSSRRKHW